MLLYERYNNRRRQGSLLSSRSFRCFASLQHDRSAVLSFRTEGRRVVEGLPEKISYSQFLRFLVASLARNDKSAFLGGHVGTAPTVGITVLLFTRTCHPERM